MSWLGIPDAPAPPCHDRPTFGCDKCISRDRDEWGKTVYLAWKKAYLLPRCPSCKKDMLHYGFDVTAKRTVSALVICSRFDIDGAPMCEDEDMTIDITPR